MIPKSPGIAKMIPKNPGIAQKDTQKSESNPQKSTQNNGTSPYQDLCKLTPPPPGGKYDDLENIKTDCVDTVVFNLYQIKCLKFFWDTR